MGNITNKFGKYITANFSDPQLRFSDAVYDIDELNNLRYFSSLYFHGHSTGGTNPSLIEAMACSCRIAAHNNHFNRAVLQEEADYFPSENEVTRIINAPEDKLMINQWKRINQEKVRIIYNQEKIIDDYEALMLSACEQRMRIIRPAVKSLKQGDQSQQGGFLRQTAERRS